MEVLTLLAVLAILIILIVNISQINGKLQLLLKEIERLRSAIIKLEQEKPATPQETVPLSTSVETIEKITPDDEISIMEVPVPETVLEGRTQENASGYEDTVRAKMEAMQTDNPQPSIHEAPITPTNSPTRAKTPTDLEKFVGENLISKIGIIILVLGVGFFVKYAIDQNWIGVYGRTAIGLLTGGIMVSLAHYLRKSYKTFSSLLTGGGCAVFYLTIAIAFHQYQIFSSAAAFIMMVVITLFSVLLSLAYDKKELAIFSQIGGYAAPFMVSSNGSYVVLFSYMLILNSGLLTLAYFKRWHVLNLIAFIFTVILFSGWLATTFWGNNAFPHRNAMIFASAFYIVFFLVNILNNVKERKPFKAAEIMMILSNNLFYFIWGLTILYSYQNGMFKGLFTILAGLFNFGWVIYLYRKKQVDKKLIYLLIALVMNYISLAIPIQLNGNSITIFWTAELVILLWISQVSEIKILKAGHIILLALVIISLIMDWANVYQYSKLRVPIIINQAFITGLVAIAGLFISAYLLKKEKEENFINYFVSTSSYRNLISTLLFLATFIIPFLELNYQLQKYYPYSSFCFVVLGIYIYAYFFTGMLVIKPHKTTALKFLFGLSCISLFLYPIIFHINVLQTRDLFFYSQDVTLGNFLFHYLAIPFVIGIIYLLNKKRQDVIPSKGFLNGLYSWFIPFLLVFIASAELDNLILLLSGAGANNLYQILEVSHKVGYPILWGLSAFLLITIGIKSKKKIFRVQALCLFGLIIAKLFLFDVWNMSEGGRIAAFVFLGVVLLLVSFLYQKLKNLLLEPNENIVSE